MRALLALLLSFSLATPQGWASAVMFLCGAESAIHVGEHRGCCEHACPDHADEASTCCSEMADSDDRAFNGTDAPAPDLFVAVLDIAPTWPTPRQFVAARPTSWLLGPPSVGPPQWLRLRILRL